MEFDEERWSGQSDIPWLRETADEELLGLFSETNEEVARTTHHLVARAQADDSILEKLVETLRISIVHQSDDSNASVWIALLLGEIRDPAALPVLLLGLGATDETVQEASADAILKMGPPAIEALMEQYEDEPSPEFAETGYRIMGVTGSFEDEQIRERVMDFLAGHVQREVARPDGECRIEALFQASALLGDRRMIEFMDRVQRERFKGRNSTIRDSREMLEENKEGRPLVHNPRPWIEAHRWLFDEDPESFRVARPGPNRHENQ